MLLELTMIQTLALASVVLLSGEIICRRIGFLQNYNIPAAVVGGFLFSLLMFGLYITQLASFKFDTTLQSPLMTAFFTTIGLSASFKLLRQNKFQVLMFWLLTAILAIFQSGFGVLLAKLFGLSPLIGLIAGSASMTGGHATGTAFGALLQHQYGLSGAIHLSMASSTFGLIAGGLLGSPLGSLLMQRYHLKREPPFFTQELASDISASKAKQGTRSNTLRVITLILMAMWAGGIVSQWLSAYFTLPSYLGAMLIAAVFRNVFDISNIQFNQEMNESIGGLCLSLFLAMALMSLPLWELSELPLSVIFILLFQVCFMALFAYFITMRFMGRDYDAAIMASGQCGLGLGATPTAIANMNALIQHYGPAPRAFIVVPLVGSFFIDFTNVLIITTYINILV
jgi:glutamate:Na+ symporter, ESS family